MEENERTVDGEVSENLEFEDFSKDLVDLPQVVTYIEKLQNHIQVQQKNILQLKEELVNYEKPSDIPKKKYVDQESQTDQLSVGEASSQQDWTLNQDNKSSSIVDQVTEAAESAMLQTGFVYEKTTGLYYHYSSGYYYDSKSGLYYDGNTGTYYYYDKENESYKFHSQIHRGSNESVSSSPSRKKREIHRESNESVSSSPSRRKKDKSSGRQNKDQIVKKIKLTECEEKNEGSDPEEGECSESENDNESSSCKDDSPNLSPNSDSESEQDKNNLKDSAKVYPPCMRIVVKETNLSNLKVGNLFIVTYTGGSIGREGDHSVIVPDINVSKHHAKLQYNETKKLYEIIDLGSRNGTLLNGKRLSVAKQESEPIEIVHGSILQLGSTKLLCHIHSGHDTCGHCEPGLLQTEAVTEEELISKKKRHRREVKRLKSKFGLEQSNEGASYVADGYQDRAQTRRDHVGSSCDHAKTQQSSLNESIPKDNLGFKMLSKMGWNEGKSLGKNNTGLAEPIPLQSNPNKAGLGSSDDYAEVGASNVVSEKKQAIWKKTQQRFNECAATLNEKDVI